MNKLIKSRHQDVDIAFAENGWINATGIAEKFSKRVNDYLTLPSTREYIAALADGEDDGLHAKSDLDRLARLEVYNTLLIGNGLNYDERKKALEYFATDCRTPQIAATKTAVIEMSSSHELIRRVF